MRLIDAYALQDEIHKSKMQNPHKDAKTATNHELEHDHFMQMVALQPTAQEEIVRCKDCVHWIPGKITDKDDFIQPRCKRNGGGWSADEYCSCAERREA